MIMITTTRGSAAATLAAVLIGASALPAVASAQPEPVSPDPGVQPVADPGEPAGEPELHNVTYRARIDGVARGAVISYRLSDTEINSADPTMLPGRVFEATAVVSDPQLAGMTVAIDWPYSANLHCEILVDDQLVAQADQFVAPRLTRVTDDPYYGTLQCGAPLDLDLGNGTGNVINTDPILPEPAAPPA